MISLRVHLLTLIFTLQSPFHIGVNADEDLIKCSDYVGTPNLIWEVPVPFRPTRLRDFNSSFSFSLALESGGFRCASNNTFMKEAGLSERKSSLVFEPDGTLYVKVNRGVFTRTQFCISRLSDESVEVRVCEVDCGMTHSCLKKCCPPGKTFSEGKCEFGADDMAEPKFYDSTDQKGCITTSNLPVHVKWGLPGKNPIHFHSPFYRLMSNGSLVTFQGNVWHVEALKYCVEFDAESRRMIVIADGTDSSSANEVDMDQTSTSTDWQFVFLTTLFVISIAFLLLTLLVYVLIWEKHNIHGWTVFAFVINLLTFFVVLLISHVVSRNATDEFLSTHSCHFLAYSHHFLYLATICWMSVINADLWLTFRSLTPPTRSKMLRRFTMYIGFAVLVPFAILLIGITLTRSKHLFTYEECGLELVSISVPGYGRDRCTLHQDGEIAYLFIPVGILLFSNLVMFTSTVLNLWRFRETTRNAVSNSSSSKQRQSLFLFVKLFFVMGITWVLELISSICSTEAWTSGDGYWFIWVPFDLLNFIQAVSVFFIFAAKRENLLFISRKYPFTRSVLRHVLKWRLCRVSADDIEQTEMTTAERGTTIKGRFSSFALTRKLSTISANSSENRRKTSFDDSTVEGKHPDDQTKV